MLFSKSASMEINAMLLYPLLMKAAEFIPGPLDNTYTCIVWVLFNAVTI